MANELLEFPGDTYGLALNLEAESIGAVIMGDYTHLEEGDTVRSTGRIVSVPVGRGMLGRVVNALGQPIDGKGPIQNDGFYPVERKAPNVDRSRAGEPPVQTGIKSIDASTPSAAASGAIIGDRQTGKTHRHRTIINQKGKDLFCIYVAIGQKRSSIARCGHAGAGRRDGYTWSGRLRLRAAACSTCAVRRLRHRRVFHENAQDALLVLR